jgi:hypothetical protein
LDEIGAVAESLLAAGELDGDAVAAIIERVGAEKQSGEPDGDQEQQEFPGLPAGSRSGGCGAPELAS